MSANGTCAHHEVNFTHTQRKLKLLAHVSAHLEQAASLLEEVQALERRDGCKDYAIDVYHELVLATQDLSIEVSEEVEAISERLR